MSHYLCDTLTLQWSGYYLGVNLVLLKFKPWNHSKWNTCYFMNEPGKNSACSFTISSLLKNNFGQDERSRTDTALRLQFAILLYFFLILFSYTTLASHWPQGSHWKVWSAHPLPVFRLQTQKYREEDCHGAIPLPTLWRFINFYSFLEFME